ncbi:lytic transglycosylase domain-containing protein [Glaciecola petra]|uniref:Transglycosylase SLT domain-containing protein n=1 Tax=Glaciecola petra TaxID=3075602 RepID=A0ABU2ZKX8_9ALTE|nr:transglycosylase SLT domain-containing protein [Aestuariibacter sp. P117]MDT0593275.1 transglycosylase SLT domain-containing protein [Aestuariibacter sp. P117]
MSNKYKKLSCVNNFLSKTTIQILIAGLISICFSCSLVAQSSSKQNSNIQSPISQTIKEQSASTESALREQITAGNPSYSLETPERLKQRAAFLRAEKTIWRMDSDEFLSTVESLGDYPLVPYLIARKISDSFSLKDEAQIRAFLNKYGDSPIGLSVRRNWLFYLARKKQYGLFIDFYRPTSNTKLRCHYIHAQMKQGINETVFYEQIADLWTVGKSQPKECDAPFKRWIKAEQLTEDLILLRIEKSADGGSHTLIPYLRSLLPTEKQYLADLWRKTRRDPSYVKALARFPAKYPNIEANIISYGLSRLIWRDAELAVRTMQKAEKSKVFSNQQKSKVYDAFGIKLAIDDANNAERWLIKSAEVSDNPEVVRWHLAYLLKQQDWQKIALLIESSPPQLVAAKDYTYWLARAYENLGREQQARVLYTQLAQSRHYYGFLASARLGQVFSLQDEPLHVNHAEALVVLSNEATERAFELKALKRFHYARAEWRYMQGQLDKRHKLVSTVISSAWAWHDQSIFTFSREDYLNDVGRRFPTAFEDLIVEEAKKNNIAPEWTFAIARRESSFMTDAVSTANARGLMQVLPSTAKYLEKRRVSAKQLLDAGTNVRIGNKYLRYLMNKLDNNSVLATASYNAGWRRVLKWLPETAPLEADIWVEIIPYRETRNYVKAVMAYKQIYRAQLSEPDATSAVQQGKVFEDFLGTAIPVSL